MDRNTGIKDCPKQALNLSLIILKLLGISLIQTMRYIVPIQPCMKCMHVVHAHCVVDNIKQNAVHAIYMQVLKDYLEI